MYYRALKHRRLAMAPQRALSVVVPAFDEAPNVRPLTERLFSATRAANIDAELLIADDESAGSAATAAAVDALAAEGYAVRLLARRRAEGRGLSSAVLLAFKQAQHATLLCMDADLQHEPESVPLTPHLPPYTTLPLPSPYPPPTPPLPLAYSSPSLTLLLP